jgi:hypothetical protein
MPPALRALQKENPLYPVESPLGFHDIEGSFLGIHFLQKVGTEFGAEFFVAQRKIYDSF